MAKEKPAFGWSVRQPVKQASAEMLAADPNFGVAVRKATVAKARKPKAGDTPSGADYAATFRNTLAQSNPVSMVRNAGDFGSYLGAKAAEYLKSHTPSEVWAAMPSHGDVLRTVAGGAVDAVEHPLSTLYDYTVGAPIDLMETAAQARHAGLAGMAENLEKGVAPAMLTAFTPEFGVFKGAAKPATRAAYDIAAEQPFKTVARRGVEDEIVRMPEAAKADLPDLRVMAQDRTRSPAIRAADAASMEARGVPYNEKAPTPASSLKRQAGMGRAFREAASENPAYQNAVFDRIGEMMPEVVDRSGARNYDQLREAAYRQLGNEVTQQFDRLPIKMRYHEGAGEYPSSPDMIRDVLANGNLNVFSGGEPHEFLSEIDPATGLSKNEMFRAVHDYLGHVVPGSMFGPQGEEVAYAAHSQMLSPLAQLALLSETRGQNSLVNYSPLNADLISVKRKLRRMDQERRYGLEYMRNTKDPYYFADIRRMIDSMPSPEEMLKQQRELGERFTYAPQKAVLLPPEYLDPMSPGGTPDWLRPILSGKSDTSARGVHFSRMPDLQATDPSFFGTGHRGSEFRPTRNAGLPDRTYFYSGPEGTVKAEDSVARIANGGVYEAPLGNLYDLQKDPEGLLDLARAYNLSDYRQQLPYNVTAKGDTSFEGDSLIPDMERLVKDYGYSGYITDSGPSWAPKEKRAAALYDPVGGLTKIGDDPYAAYASGGLVKG